MAADQTEKLLKAIKTTQELRASVANVFDKLTNGIKDTEKPDGKDKVFLNELQQCLLAVNRDIGDLEKLSASVTPIGLPPNLGNSSMLSLDPNIEKSSIYTQLIRAYKWANKMHDQAGTSVMLLHSNSLKRSHTSITSAIAKKVRKMPPNLHNASTPVVDSMIASWGRLFPDMKINVTRPIGSPAVLQITIHRTMHAIVVLRGMVIEKVLIKGFNEQVHNENGKIDIWSPSKYQVFRKITDHTSAALLHFYSPTIQEIAVRSFMSWLHSYINLFSSPCLKCGKHLLDNLPPTWHDFRTKEAYHENCRP